MATTRPTSAPAAAPSASSTRTSSRPPPTSPTRRRPSCSPARRRRPARRRSSSATATRTRSTAAESRASRAHQDPYLLLTGAGGFTDQWLRFAPAALGFTSGLSELVNDSPAAAAAAFNHRIDLVLGRAADGRSLPVQWGWVTGRNPLNRTPTTPIGRLWPSDHAGRRAALAAVASASGGAPACAATPSLPMDPARHAGLYLDGRRLRARLRAARRTAPCPAAGALLPHARLRPGRAEDALQEPFVRAWRGLPGFERRSSLRTWRNRIATNVCLKALERPPRRLVRSTPLPSATRMASCRRPRPS